MENKANKERVSRGKEGLGIGEMMEEGVGVNKR